MRPANLEYDDGRRNECQKARCVQLVAKVVDGTQYKDGKVIQEGRTLLGLFTHLLTTDQEDMRYGPFLRRFKRFFQGIKKRMALNNVEDQIRNIVKSRHDLLHIFDGFSDPIIVIDKQFVIQRVNRAIPTALGKESFMQFIGRPCYEMLHGLKQRCPECTAPTTFTSGEKTGRSGFMEAQENSSRPIFNITCYPIIDEEGEVISIAEYYRDFSDIVNLTRQLYESERARVMEPLVVGLTHQIRQPLTVVRAAAQYTLETFKTTLRSKDFQETMESIIQNVDTVNDVIINLFHFSKPSPYTMKKGSLPELLERGLRLVRTQIKEQKVSVQKEWPQDLPATLMDEKLLLHAYVNLLVNALQSMTQGGRLTVTASYQENSVPPRVCMAIEDTGMGISKEHLCKLGQPFFTTKNGGVGLGVAVAEGIIGAHNGKIHFESQENQGTKATIELYLPS